MCRNIHTLFNFEPPATEDEVRGAAVQYVRKVSGFTKPSQANEQAFEQAVDEVAAATARLLDALSTNAPELSEVAGGSAVKPGSPAPWAESPTLTPVRAAPCATVPLSVADWPKTIFSGAAPSVSVTSAGCVV